MLMATTLLKYIRATIGSTRSMYLHLEVR
jgi:hypothetical protein